MALLIWLQFFQDDTCERSCKQRSGQTSQWLASNHSPFLCPTSKFRPKLIWATIKSSHTKLSMIIISSYVVLFINCCTCSCSLFFTALAKVTLTCNTDSLVSLLLIQNISIPVTCQTHKIEKLIILEYSRLIL